MKSFVRRSAVTLAAGLAVTAAQAIPETRTSPTGGVLPVAVTEIGGIVLDLKGTNGVRLVAQLAASSLFVGSPAAGQYPLLIGTQTGFDAASLAALGGTLSGVSVRVTLFDGDNQSGNFDFNNNNLLLDGADIGSFSTVQTFRTDAIGTTQIGGPTLGFGNNILNTGFFSSTDATFLSSLLTNLADGSLAYRVADTDPGDQFYDFKQGVDGGLINVGTPPVVVPGIPEPETYAMMALGLGALGWVARRKRGRKAA